MKAFSFIIALVIPFAILSGVFYKVFPGLSRSTQPFDNIIIENVARSGYNKSAEITLFWIMAVLAVLLTIVILYLTGVLRSLLKKNKKLPAESGIQNEKPLTAPKNKLPLSAGVTLLPPLAHLLAFGQLSQACLLGLVYFLSVMFYTRKKEKSVAAYLLLPVLTYYSLMAVLTCGVRLTSSLALSTNTIYGITVFLTLLFFGISRFSGISINQLLLILQLPVPLLLVLFFVDRYLYRSEIIRVTYAPFYYVFFGGLLAFFLALLILHVKKHLKTATQSGTSGLIHYVTAVTVFVYNSWSACPMYAQPDQHHHGEQMIPWQQIVTLGQSAYEEYTPVSGLFPMVNGFIQNVLLGGTVSDYSPAITIMMTLFCIVTMYLICRHIGGAYGLLIAIFFALPSYNRQYMVLPVLLLLFLPGLLKKPGRWVKVWIFSCFLAGLYYPLYGAAVLVGTIPLGIHMFLRMLRETRWKEECKKPSFYGGWFICLFPIVLCIPLLLRMVTHTLTYSGQTILADGISLYGQSVPDFFLPYLAGNQESIRLWLYYGLRFFLPMVPFVVGCGLLFLAGKSHGKVSLFSRTGFLSKQKNKDAVVRNYVDIDIEKDTEIDIEKNRNSEKDTHIDRYHIDNIENIDNRNIDNRNIDNRNIDNRNIDNRNIDNTNTTGGKYLIYGLLAVMISLGISYTYTLVRADTGMILSRTAPVLISVMGIFLPVLLVKYGKELLPRSVCITVMGLCFSLPLLLYNKVSAMKFPDMWIYPNGEAALIMDDSDKLFSYYEVPETFVAMEEIKLSDTSMLGQGFMVADQIPYLEQYDSVMKKCSDVAPETCYMGFDGQGFYYYLNAKACSTGFIQAGKGYEAQQSVLKQAKEKRPVIFLMEPQSTYYVYYWMMTADYMYCQRDGAFYPKELYEKLYPESPSGDDYRSFCPATDFGLVADSFGSSMDTLMPLFEEEQMLPGKETLSGPIRGTEYDFLYLSFHNSVPAEVQSLRITFLCDGRSYEGASVTCLTGEGRLLIPLGMNADWLLSENSQITFSLLGESGKTVSVLSLEEISDLAEECRFLKLKKDR